MISHATVLVTDDDANDIYLLKRAFLKAGIDVALKVARDGEEAIQYLHGDNNFADRAAYPFPNLMLMDIKMPGASGFDVLEWMRQQSGLRRLPVVIMSSSDDSEDIDHAYDLGANSFLRKPHAFSELVKITRRLHEYWMETNLCPNCESSKYRGHGLRAASLRSRAA